MQDLVFNASHAVFTGSVLVPVVNLVNGTSIVFETADDHETLDFFHVALARHDVLDAQGPACELWRDASIIVDRRQPLDLIRDSLEERGLELAGAA